MAVKKILADRGLETKMNYIIEVLERDVLKSSAKLYASPLEVHCAVVCCNVSDRKVMIMHRGTQHSTNPEKWEFGCAKLVSEKKLVNSITEYYKDEFGLEIELVLDDGRKDNQPIPIAVYELKNEETIKKGIIFVAKVTNKINCEDFRPEKSHDNIKWISEEEISQYKNNAVSDFEDTLKKVFANFDEFFHNKENINE